MLQLLGIVIQAAIQHQALIPTEIVLTPSLKLRGANSSRWQIL